MRRYKRRCDYRAKLRTHSEFFVNDKGPQDTSAAFGHWCHQAQIRVSMGSVGDCYDNVMRESFEIIANVVYSGLGGVLLRSNAIFELDTAHDCGQLLGAV